MELDPQQFQITTANPLFCGRCWKSWYGSWTRRMQKISVSLCAYLLLWVAKHAWASYCLLQCSTMTHHTKTTSNLGNIIFLCSQNDCTDPNSIIDKHIKINQLPLHYPLFSYCYGDSYAALTKCKFLRCCKDIWSQYGLPMFTGHCFHISGTTILLLHGVSLYSEKNGMLDFTCIPQIVLVMGNPSQTQKYLPLFVLCHSHQNEWPKSLGTLYGFHSHIQIETSSERSIWKVANE